MMRYVGYIACMGKLIMHSLCSGNPNGKIIWKDPSIEWWITLKLIFKKQEDRHGLD
jgi:hypothetical protein